MKKQIVTLESIIKFQDALIQLYEAKEELETYKEGTLKFDLFRDGVKSQIESLKEEYGNL